MQLTPDPPHSCPHGQAKLLDEGERVQKACVASYRAWVAWPCAGAAQCCPRLAALGPACLNELVHAAASRSRSMLREV